MTALADIADAKSAAAPKAQTICSAAKAANSLKRGLMTFFGVAAIGASLGLWVVHSAYGDMAMLLVKLLVSAALLLGGMLMIRALAQSPLTEVQLDPVHRQLRVVKCGGGEAPVLVSCHDLDELTEIELRDRLLTARDKDGQQVLSIDVADAMAEEAIREALEAVT